MGNTCVPQQGLRFKNFVVAVFTQDPQHGSVRDAFGNLKDYVASNPERIPRVCRKISKLLVIPLRRHKVHRVMVGVQMLRDLIAQSDDVGGFVPHCISICSMLLSHYTVEYRVGAADVLAILCYKLSRRVDVEHSCRLLTDSQEKLLPPLEKMCLETIDNDDAATLRCRYAAIVALGNVIYCLHGALADIAGRQKVAFLQNLFNAMRAGGESQWPKHDPPVVLLQHIKSGPFDSVALPTEPRQRDLACISAASWGIGAVVGRVSTAGIYQFLQLVLEFIASCDGWSVPGFASVTLRSLARALEWRPQQLGFSVCQCLCEMVMAPRKKEEETAKVQEGVLRALIVCTHEVRMTGGRPQLLFELLCKCMSRPNQTEDYNNLLLQLLATLMYTTHRWRNAPRLHLLLVGLLGACQEPTSKNVMRGLRALAVAAPYVRAVPLTDRTDINFAGAIAPFLATHDAAQTYAAQVLVGLLAGKIPQQGPAADGGVFEAATEMAEPPPPLVTDEQDVAVAKNWVLSLLAGARPVTPTCVIEVGRVVAAVMQSRGAAALPFVLAVVSQLQAFVANDKKIPDLHVAWAHLSLVVLVNCGEVLALPQLLRYAADLLQQRRHRSELAKQFSSRLTDGAVGALHLAGGSNMPEEPLRSQPASHPPLTLLISFEAVAEAIAGDAGAAVYAAFGARAAAELKAAIVGALLRPDADDVGTPPPTPRARARAQSRPHFSLEAPRRCHGNEGASVTVSVVEGGAAAGDAAAPAAAPSSGRRELFTGRARDSIAGLLARHCVVATTQLGQRHARDALLAPAIERREKTTNAGKTAAEAAAEDAGAAKNGATDSRGLYAAAGSFCRTPISPNAQSTRSNPKTRNHTFADDGNGFLDGPPDVVSADARKRHSRAHSSCSVYSNTHGGAGERSDERVAAKNDNVAVAVGKDRPVRNYVDLL
ncbi:uncharacterized protein Tco025E_04564 [Trypanosoma conorhini]|uniref:Uncharacterized protein n=1 Tax=Trypanosoma conorhini TaxID=83891 RepID=A0A3R7KZN0_9TRYP|nr:uncharacterized protein Tco025E_04564 [Trypanosoma conorhini]RNF18215.1 hypothetical protein Tco025E_04564 [Trypanosoma conorhini]